MPSSPPHDAVIQNLSTDGRGVVRIGETVYFVPRALPGDRVLLALEPDAKPPNAVVTSLVEPSPLRVPHPCIHAAECSGSLWGSLDYEAQLFHKRELVARTLRYAVPDAHVLPTVPSPLTWRYRNRISLNVWLDEGKMRVGFHTEARRQSGVPIHTCYLPSESVSLCLNELATFLNDADAAALPVPRRIQIHNTAAGAGLLMLFNQDVVPSIAHQWTAVIAPIAPGGIWFAESARGGVANLHKPVLKTQGALPMRTDWLGHTVKVHPASFCQANSASANLIGERLLRFSAEHDYAQVWDLYGGFGALGLAAAGKNRAVTVFELSKFSKDAMDALAAGMEVTQTRFVHGDLLTVFPRRASDITENDLVILDPPRSGVHPEILTSLIRSRARLVIYLSCNVARLARDLAILLPAGFSPLEIQPYDFFPQTPAIEVLAILNRS